MPKGIPMIVTKLAIAHATCPSASQTPAKMNQMTFPIVPKAPVPISSAWLRSRLLIASLPNGKKEKLPMTKHALPHGMPIIVM